MKQFRTLLLSRASLNVFDSIFYTVLYSSILIQTQNILLSMLIPVIFESGNILSLFIGPFVERLNKRKLSIYTAGISAIFIIIVSFLSYEYTTLKFTLLTILLFIFVLLDKYIYLAQETIASRQMKELDTTYKFSMLELVGSSFDFAINGVLYLAIAAVGFSFIINLNYLVICVLLLSTFLLKVKQFSVSENVTFIKDLNIGIKAFKKFQVKKIVFPLIIFNILYALNFSFTMSFSYLYYNNTFGIGITTVLSGLASIITAFIISKNEFYIFKKHEDMVKISIIITALCAVLQLFAVSINSFGIFLISSFITTSTLTALGIYSKSRVVESVPSKYIGRVHALNWSIITVSIPVGYLVGGCIVENLQLYYIPLIRTVILLILLIFLHKKRKL